MNDGWPLSHNGFSGKAIFKGHCCYKELPYVVTLKVPVSLGIFHDDGNNFLEIAVNRPTNLE